MNKFIATISIWSLAIILSVFVMMYGWGLAPVSWWWIIGGGVGIRSLIEVMNYLSKLD